MIKIKKIIFIIFLLGILTGCKEAPEPKETNQDKEAIQEYTTNNITFDNIKIDYEEKLTSISVTIHNNQDETINLGSFKLNALDKDGQLIKTFDAYYGLDIAPNDEGEVTVSVDQKLEDIKSITITLNEKEK